ncbi:hypothetical protein K438DRAFT_1940021 [Mycena galopus ATCC 62051]|nr:hypothetical protein K438DRAFT_1940021 [Mycena galopus ATCC 62051]
MSASSTFPNEIWLDVFLYLDVSPFRAILVASRWFQGLRLRAILPNLVWHSVQKAEANIEFWGNITCRRIPRTLRINLKSHHRYMTESHPAIVHSVPRFCNLGSLSLSQAHLWISFDKVLVNLPRLAYLRLQSCGLGQSPSHFPHSFPGLSSDPAEVPITNLSLDDVQPYIYPDMDEGNKTPNFIDMEFPQVLPLFTFLPQEVLALIEFASGVPLQQFEIRMPHWDDEILLANPAHHHAPPSLMPGPESCLPTSPAVPYYLASLTPMHLEPLAILPEHAA